MLQPEQEITREFAVRAPNPKVRELVERLKGPTRIGGELAREINPRTWYGQVYHGPFQGPRWDEFVKRYQERVAKDPGLSAPYVAIGADWKPIPIYQLPKVRELLLRLKKELRSAIQYVAETQNGDDAWEQFGEYLQGTADMLPFGLFDEVMALGIAIPAFPLVWQVNLVEYYSDPQGKKAAPQGLLGIVSGRSRNSTDNFVKTFNQAAQDMYERVPLPAHTFPLRSVILAGFLAQFPVSAFHIPNRESVIEEAKGSQICLLMGRMIDKFDRQLRPAGRTVLGMESDFGDIYYSVIGHEQSHRFREKGENDRWGIYYGAGRESRAIFKNIAMSGNSRYSDFLRRKINKGSLVYAADDVAEMSHLLLMKYGQSQPTLETLNQRGYEHRVPGYILLRRESLNGHLQLAGVSGEPRFNVDGIIYFSQELDRGLDEIAKNGNQEEAGRFFRSYLEEPIYFPGVDNHDSPQQTTT